LIIGRTSAFLLDPNSADLETKKAVTRTQSHEVAHMWLVWIFIAYNLLLDIYLYLQVREPDNNGMVGLSLLE
jgi:hypothetical protein